MWLLKSLFLLASYGMGAICVGSALRRGNPSSPTYTPATRQQKGHKEGAEFAVTIQLATCVCGEWCVERLLRPFRLG